MRGQPLRAIGIGAFKMDVTDPAEASSYFTFITPRMMRWWPGNEQM